MGTPNNPQPRTAEELLRDLVSNPSHGLTETDAHALGLDVDLAEATFQSNVKPYLDYLAGYEPLEQHEPTGISWYKSKWAQLLMGQSSTSRDPQTLLVIRDRLYDTLVGNRYKQGTGDRFVAVFLSRRGSWYFWWTDYKSPVEFSNDHISHHSNLRSLCAAIERATPKRYEFAGESSRGNPPKYAPMLIEFGLHRILQHTIAERDLRLSTMRHSLAEAGERANTIAIGR